MISIIDYRAGNLKSVERALKHIGASCRVTANRDTVRNSERIIFPGVGAAGQAMGNLKELGLDVVISDAFRSGKPILGICLGTQIILEKSEENDSTCLGLIEGSTKRFPEVLSSGPGRLKIPHPNGIRFSSVVGARNLVAMQFHLEKSGPAGLKILRNFCNWDGNA